MCYIIITASGVARNIGLAGAPLKPERLKFEAKTENGEGFVGRAQRAPSPPARSGGEL